MNDRETLEHAEDRLALGSALRRAEEQWSRARSIAQVASRW